MRAPDYDLAALDLPSYISNYPRHTQRLQFSEEKVEITSWYDLLHWSKYIYILISLILHNILKGQHIKPINRWKYFFNCIDFRERGRGRER